MKLWTLLPALVATLVLGSGCGDDSADPVDTSASETPTGTDKSQLEDPNHPCADAVPMKHSHFFTEDGQFGSRDDAGMQVDDGPYRLVGSDKLVIGGADHEVTFRYEIDGDTLRLYPRLPACAKTGCFPAQWAVAVSYNGLPWTKLG